MVSPLIALQEEFERVEFDSCGTKALGRLHLERSFLLRHAHEEILVSTESFAVFVASSIANMGTSNEHK